MPSLTPYSGQVWFGDQVQASPLGILNTMVTVEWYFVPIKFLIIKMAQGPRFQSRVILGRSFLATTRAHLNFDECVLTLHMCNTMLAFNPGGWINFTKPRNLVFLVSR